MKQGAATVLTDDVSLWVFMEVVKKCVVSAPGKKAVE